MQDQKRYTLETLATEFGLTPRMARYYVEKLLPEHHKTGRGKLAEYGPDTWNCFVFIQKARDEQKLSLEQIRDVLARLSQQQIDRVARGEEEIAIVTTPAEPELPPDARAHYYPSREWAPEDEGPMISKMSVSSAPSAMPMRYERKTHRSSPRALQHRNGHRQGPDRGTAGVNSGGKVAAGAPRPRSALDREPPVSPG